MPSISKPCNARPHDKTILRKLSIPLNRIAHPTAKVQKKQHNTPTPNGRANALNHSTKYNFLIFKQKQTYHHEKAAINQY